ncbi:MAG: methanogenesis marker 17 protein [Candidatus Methanomethylicaceae archaeon]
MKLIIDSTDKKGGELYRRIVERSIEDLALGGSIVGVSVLIRPEIPLFVIKIKYRERESKNLLGDLARIETRVGSVKLILEDEIDLGDVLRSLWSTFGRDKVEQVGRMEVVVKGVEPESLKVLKIREARISVTEKVNEVVNRIIPEGFRVRVSIKDEECLTVIAAEDPLKEEWERIAASLEVNC